MVDLDARAGGNQRLALCNHFCLFHPAPFSLSPLTYHPRTPFAFHTRRTRVLTREGREGCCGSTYTYTIALVGVHTNSGRAGDGITLCRCVYEHARATCERSERDAEERRIDPTHHTLLRVLSVFFSSPLARHTSA